MGALRHYRGLQASIQKEVDAGWISQAFSHPPTVPFQVRPAGTEGEPKADGTYRVIWDASWPKEDSLGGYDHVEKAASTGCSKR